MLSYAAGQITGPRTTQEDTILADKQSNFTPSIQGEWDMTKAGLFAIADGMGGHENGEIASHDAADALNSSISNGTTIWDAFENANEMVNQIPRHFGDSPGTTLTALFFDLSSLAAEKSRMGAGMVIIGHIGDSRCYRLRRGFMSPRVKEDGSGEDGEFEMLTKDHAFGRYLGRVIGVPAARYVPPDVSFDRIEYGDRYMLCSDGLSNVLKDEEIAVILRGTQTAQDAVDTFLKLNGEDAVDNTSVIVIDVVPNPPQPEPENKPCIHRGPKLMVTFGNLPK